MMTSKKFTRIPLKRLATGHYKTTAKINNTKGDFIIDTGASSTCVAYSFASLFNLELEPSEIKAAGAGASGMETHLSKENDLIIKDQIVPNFTLVLFDLTHVNNALIEVNESPIHGIFGADLLKKCRAVIDYGRNCMYIK